MNFNPRNAVPTSRDCDGLSELVDDAARGLGDVAAGRVKDARASLAAIKSQRSVGKSGKKDCLPSS